MDALAISSNYEQGRHSNGGEHYPMQDFHSPEIHLGRRPSLTKSRRPFERDHNDFSYSSVSFAGAHGETGDGVKLIPVPPGGFDPPPQQYKKSPRKLHRICTNWWREATAAFLLVGSAIATFATLYPNQGRPIPQWPLSITINALVSVWMLVLRGSAGYLLAEGIGHQKWRWFDEKARPLYDLVLHDEASRGPYGALKLLFRVPIWHVWHWLGCILIVVAVVIGPFSQQVIQYVDCVVPVDHSVPAASMPRTNIFVGAGRHSGAGLITLTQPEQAAINAGTYAPGSNVPFACLSGNCTFPDYTTIGYCSACTDVSSELKIVNKNFTIDQYGEKTQSPGTYSYLPSTSEYYPDVGVLWLKDAYTFNLSTIAVLENNFEFIVGLPGSPYDANTGLAPTGCDDAVSKESWRCKGYGAANCTMYPCLRTYRAEVTNGVLNEMLVAETVKGEPWETSEGTLADGRYVYATINTTCLNGDQQDLLRKAGYVFNSTTEWLSYNMTGSDEPAFGNVSGVSNSDILAFEQQIQDQACLYAIDQFFDMSLSTSMGVSFTGNLTGSKNNDGNEIQFFSGPQVLQVLYNFGDFGYERTNSLFQNISESLTNHMRVTPGTNITSMFRAAAGDEFNDKTCLRVAWAWLSLPAALGVLTMIYVIGSLLSLGSLSHGMRTWRTSPLPMVFHGPVLRSNIEDLQDIRDMERVAKSTRARLVPDANGSMAMQLQDLMEMPR